ncbi:MAG: class I SAM-dependent methyltransferase [Limnohabitans sp.]
MHGNEAPSLWIQRWAHLIAPASRVLDLACGAGRHMQLLHKLGHQPLGVDRSDEALAAAGAWGETLQADIENAPWPLDKQQFGAVIVTHYLWRPLWPRIMDSIQSGGVLLYETFAQGHETVGRPSRPDFLLAPGELLQVTLEAGLRVIAYEDGFLTDPERFVQRIAAVRETATPTPARRALF